MTPAASFTHQFSAMFLGNVAGIGVMSVLSVACSICVLHTRLVCRTLNLDPHLCLGCGSKYFHVQTCLACLKNE